MDFIDKLIGKWILVKKNNFEDFLKYVNRSWITRKIANNCNIYITIKKKDDGYLKSVGSNFYMSEDFIKLDNKFRPYHNGELMSQYFYNNSKVCSNNVTKDYKWFEIVHYNSPNLIVEYHWILNEQKYSCILEFIKT